jgi:hypothetical protein
MTRPKGTAANTRECFTEFIGQRVVGVLFDALPAHRGDLAAGTKTLIFEDGRGLTIASNGTCWIERADEIERAARAVALELEATRRRLQGVLRIADRVA